jgi:hypothetical protein
MSFNNTQRTFTMASCRKVLNASVSFCADCFKASVSGSHAEPYECTASAQCCSMDTCSRAASRESCKACVAAAAAVSAASCFRKPSLSAREVSSSCLKLPICSISAPHALT